MVFSLIKGGLRTLQAQIVEKRGNTNVLKRFCRVDEKEEESSEVFAQYAISYNILPPRVKI